MGLTVYILSFLRTLGPTSVWMTRVEFFSRLGFFFNLLLALHSDPMCRHTGRLNAPVCGLHYSDGNPTFDVSPRP